MDCCAMSRLLAELSAQERLSLMMSKGEARLEGMVVGARQPWRDKCYGRSTIAVDIVGAVRLMRTSL